MRPVAAIYNHHGIRFQGGKGYAHELSIRDKAKFAAGRALRIKTTSGVCLETQSVAQGSRETLQKKSGLSGDRREFFDIMKGDVIVYQWHTRFRWWFFSAGFRDWR